MKKSKTPIFSIKHNPFETGLIKEPSKKTMSTMNRLYYIIMFLALVMLFTCNPANAQKKDTTVKKDTVPQLYDTSKFISVGDIVRLFNAAKPQINGVEYEAFQKIWNYIQATLVREWEDKNKKKP